MPKAFKCSKCGDLFEGEAEWCEEFEALSEQVDLCGKCHERLLGWFDGHDVTNLDDYNGE